MEQGDHMRLRSKHPAFSIEKKRWQMSSVGMHDFYFVEGCDLLVPALQVQEFTSNFNIMQVGLV